jgi:hypothetical protein
VNLFSFRRFLLPAAIAVNACDKSGESSELPARDRPNGPSNTVSAAPLDPCSFLTKEDLGSALGRVFTDGKATPNEPSCTFGSANGGTVTIALPSAAVSATEFSAWKEMAGGQAETVSGIGDAAYFWGSRLYVHQGNRTATISIADADLTPELKAGLRKLGEIAATKLR